MPKPPPVIDCARLLHYAVTDKSLVYSGRTILFVGGKEVGRVPCLAICKNKISNGVLLFHCRRDWSVIGCSAHESVATAKKRAGRIYSGLSTCWRESHVTKDKAERFLNKLFGETRCSCCGRRPDQIGRLFSKGRALVCGSCVEELHEMMLDPSKGR